MPQNTSPSPFAHFAAAALAPDGRYLAASWMNSTVALVDISERDSYLIDIFRVIGGAEHNRFLHGHFGQATAHGLSLVQAEEPRSGQLMRGLKRDPTPSEVLALTELVERMMGGLDERERDVVSLHLQGYAGVEIVEQTGRSQRTVSRILERVRQQLHVLCAEGEE